MFKFLVWLLPLVTTGLLAGAAGRCLLRFCAGDTEGQTLADRYARKGTARAMLGCFAVCWAAVGFCCLWAGWSAPDAPLEQALHKVFPTSMDADHYVQLAQYGYGAGELFPQQYLMIVFFPLFPWLLRGVQALTGLGGYTAGLLMQPFLFAVGGGALYALVRRHYGRTTANWTLVLLLASPGAFFFAAPMTESLYLALTMLAMCAVDRDKPALFVPLGFAAALTRSTGGLLALAAGTAWLCALRKGRRTAAWLLAAFAPCAGTAAYLWLNWANYGDAFAFMTYQKQHWSQGLGWIGDTVRYLLEYAVGWWNTNRTFALYVSLAGLLCILGQVILLAMGSSRLPLPWMAYGLGYVIVAFGATWLLSGPRYALSMPFVPLCAALCAQNDRHRIALLAFMTAASALYWAKYLAWGPIC